MEDLGTAEADTNLLQVQCESVEKSLATESTMDTDEDMIQPLKLEIQILREELEKVSKKIIDMLTETKTRLESSVQGADYSCAHIHMKSKYSDSASLDRNLGNINRRQGSICNH